MLFAWIDTFSSMCLVLLPIFYLRVHHISLHSCVSPLVDFFWRSVHTYTAKRTSKERRMLPSSLLLTIQPCSFLHDFYAFNNVTRHFRTSICLFFKQAIEIFRLRREIPLFTSLILLKAFSFGLFNWLVFNSFYISFSNF